MTLRRSGTQLTLPAINRAVTPFDALLSNPTRWQKVAKG
jgi:hypothetical protein